MTAGGKKPKSEESPPKGIRCPRCGCPDFRDELGTNWAGRGECSRPLACQARYAAIGYADIAASGFGPKKLEVDNAERAFIVAAMSRATVESNKTAKGPVPGTTYVRSRACWGRSFFVRV